MENFTRGSLTQSNAGIWRKLGGALLGLAILFAFSNTAFGQAVGSEDFQAGGTGTWSQTGGFGNTSSLPCESTRSVRDNLWGGSATSTLTSPNLGTSNGLLVTMTFDYKITNWSAGTVATGTGWGNIQVQYGSSATGPWTTALTIDDGNHVTSASCANMMATFTPANGTDVYVRFLNTYTGGDYWLYYDRIEILQATPTCSGATAATASISATGGCDGAALALTAAGMDVGTGLSSQWEFSNDNFATDINDLVGETGATANITAPASTVYYRLRTTCTPSATTVYSNVVSYAGVSCASVVVPFSGNTSNDCGTDAIVRDHGGTANYGNNADGYLVLENTPGSFIAITGTYATEGCCDGGTIYSGVGTGGTVVATFAGSGTLTPISGADGEAFTIQFDSDFSVNDAGFEFQVLYSGTCLQCTGTPAGGTAAIDDADGCQNAPIELSATGLDAINIDYQWQFSNDNFVSDINDIAGATNATVNTNAPGTAGVTYYRLRSTCTDNSNVAYSSVVTYTAVSCGAASLPGTSGSNNTLTCGVNTWFYDDAGGATVYQNSYDSYTVIDASNTAVINLSGVYETEGCCDDIYIYYGVGTGGTQVPGSPFAGSGSIDITGNVGEALTVRLDSDFSVNDDGFAFEVIYSGVCASCTAPPAGGTVSIPSTSGCAGNTITLTTSGLDIGADNTYQWQVSNDNFVSDINDITGETGQTYDLTTVTGTNYYRLASFCSADLGQPAYSNIVSFAGITCSQTSVPTTGNNTVSCGTTTQLTDDGGTSANYSNNADGYTVFERNGSAEIVFSGTYAFESCCDRLYIYNGSGTGGTLLYSYGGGGSGSILPFTWGDDPGEDNITFRIDADFSVNAAGIDILGVYSGACDPCPSAPTTNGATLVTNNSATINWNHASQIPAVGYEWEVRDDNGTPGTPGAFDTGTTNNSTTSAALGTPALTGNTTYEFFVRSECVASTDYSAWSSAGTFTTACDAEVAPTVPETFDTYAGSAPDPACWSEVDIVTPIPTTAAAVAAGDGNWIATTGFANTGANPGAKVNLWSATGEYGWLVSQPVDISGLTTPRVRFRFAVTGWNTATTATDMDGNEVHVVVSTDGGATWDDGDIIYTFDDVSMTDGSAQDLALDLSAYSGTIKVAFVGIGGGVTFAGVDFHVDNFVIEETPTCFEPTVTAATNVTNNSATINWNASSPIPDQYYEWEVRDDAAAPGSGGEIETDITPDNVTLSANLTVTLTANTTYSVYVRGRCLGSDYSAWNGPITFTTTCNPETAPTVVETFSSYTGDAPNPLCWDEAIGAIGTPSALTDANSGWVATSGFGNTGSDAGVKDNLWGFSPETNWLISQPIDLGVTPGVYRVSYRAELTSFNNPTVQTNMGTNSVSIIVSADGGNTWNAADVIYTHTGAFAGGTFTHDLTYTGVVKIAIVNNIISTAADRDFHIDDFVVEEIPPCVDPTLAAATDITSTTATINWVEPGTLPGVGYEWVVYETSAGNSPGDPVADPGQEGSEVVGTTAGAVTNLTPNTTYSYYVRSECTAGTQYSAWTSAGTFTTECAPEVAPTVLETFDTYLGNAPDPLCWSEGQGTIGTPSAVTIINSGWGYATSSPNTPGDFTAGINLYGTTNEWLISQPIDLGVTPGEYRVSFEMIATAWVFSGFGPILSDIGGHEVSVIVSQDAGATWNAADVIATYTGAGTYDGSAATTIDLTAYSGVVKIAFVSNTSSFSPDVMFWVDDFIVEEIPTCFEPTALTATNIGINGADVSWTAPTLGTPTGYEYEVSTSATPPATGTSVPGTSVTGITGLTSGTEYFLHVRTACIAPGDFSEWVTYSFYTTFENPFCIPGGVPIPGNACGVDELEQEVLVSGIVGTLGNEVILNKVSLNIVHTWDGDLTITLISPTGTEVVLSDGNGGSGDNYGGELCNETPTNFRMDAGTAIAGLGAGSAPFAGDYLPEGDFADFDGEDPNGLWTLRVCDGAAGDDGSLVYYRLQIIPPPTCFEPSNLVVSGLAPTQATVTWDAGSGTPGPSSYQFYYNTTGIAPDELTTPTGPATGLSVFLNTLTPGTHYYFWVRSNCGIQQSEWSTVVEFDTPLPNDLCSGATEVFCGGSYNDNSENATAEVVPGQGGSTGPGLWYKFIGTGGDVRFETCATGLTFDSEINVFTGSCGSLTNVGNNDDDCGGGGNFGSGVDVSTVAGTEYLIYVSSYASFEPGGAFTLDVICGGFWTGATSADWATAGNWSSGAVPGTGDNAVIPSSPSGGNFPDVAVSVAGVVNDLIVQSGANIDINDGGSITVEGDLTLDGVINISNDGSLVQETGSGLSGSGQVNVTKNGSTTGYDYWSSPVINGGLGAYYGFNSANSTIDPSDDDNDPGWFQTSGAIPTAKGGAFFAAGTRTFTGTPNNGTLNIGVTDNAPPADDWDLLGNPYPSGVDIAAWVAANSGIVTGGMSFWDVDAYASHNGLIGNNFQSTGPNTTAGNGILGSCQGFMALATGTGSVTFTNAMRVADNSSELYRLAQLQTLKVSAVSAVHGANQTTVGFYDNSVDGVDGFDTEKLGILADISLYSWIAGGEYAINFMSPLAAAVEIPLGMHTIVATNVTFTLDEFTDMDNEFIYLEDRVAGVFTDLKQGDYVFAASAMHYTDRFYLHVSTSAITGIEDQVELVGMNAYVADEMLNVFSTEEVTGDLEVLDMSGKVVLTRSGMIVGPNGIQLSLSALSDGVYMVRLVGEDANMTQKVLK